MGLSAPLVRLAARAPVPVFGVAGAGARDAVQDLGADARITLVDTPRPANVLLLAGGFPPPLAAAAAAAHDAMSHPRCTVWWSPQDGGPAPGEPFADVTAVSHGDDVADIVVEHHRRLLADARPSEPPLLPDEGPAPWRGEGPYGQGGSGMTGGVPYGRPMADRGDDRDALTLDQLPVKVGPLFAAFPAGLVLDITLQGDVLQEVVVEGNPFEHGLRLPPPGLQPFFRALAAPVPVAEVEVARARRHLRWLAMALGVHGLPALGRRVLQKSAAVAPADADAVRALGRAVRRTRAIGWATAGVGVIRGPQAQGLGLPARAAGVAEDARSSDPAYQGLGFAAIVHDGGDASARWRQRIAEAAQALDLAAAAGDARTGHGLRVEAPGGPLAAGASPSGQLLTLLPELLTGAEWGDAVATIVSLDLDLEEAAAARTGVGEPGR